MNIFARVKQQVTAVVADLTQAGRLPAGLDLSRISVDPPRDSSHGDVSTNAAMVLAKPAGLAPKALADLLVERLRQSAGVTEASVAGPGFINLRLAENLWREVLRTVLITG